MDISYWLFIVTFNLSIFWTTCEEEFNQEGFLIKKQTDVDTFLQFSTAQYARVKIGYCGSSVAVSQPSAYYVFRVYADSHVSCKKKPCDCRISLDHLFQRTYSGKGFLVEFDYNAAVNSTQLYEQQLFSKYTGHILVFRSLEGPGGGKDQNLKIEQKLLPSGKQFKCQWGYMFDEQLDVIFGYTREQLDNMYKRYSDTLDATQKKTGVGYIILDAYHLSHTDPERFKGLAWNKVNLIIYLNDGHKEKVNPAKLKKAMAYFQQGHVKSIRYFLPNRLITRLESVLPNIDWSRRPFAKQGSLLRSDIPKYYQTPNSVLEIDAVNCEETDFYGFDPKCRSGFYINVMLEPILVDANIVAVHFLDHFGKPLTNLAKFDFSSIQGPVFYFLKLFPGPNYDQNILLDVVKSVSNEKPIFLVGFGEKTGSRKAYNEEDGKKLASFINDPAYKGYTFGVRLRIDFFATNNGIEWMVDATKNKLLKYLFLHDSTRQGLEVETIGELSKTEVENLQNNINQLDMETYFVAADTVFAGSRIDPFINVTNPPTTTTAQIQSTVTKFTRATDDPFIPGEVMPSGTGVVSWVFASAILQVLLFLPHNDM